MPELSVVIITYNEEKNIARCLDSVQGIADDIVVVDSFSSDQTPEICSGYKLNFIQCKWEGYSATKNFANNVARFNWILSLDADEALSDELRASILKIKQGDQLLTCEFNRLTNYCGSWIRHGGWYPDKKIRIFDRSIARWTGLIHEELTFAQPVQVRHLAGDCLHYSYYTKAQHYRQADNFTTLAAKDLYEKGKKASLLRLLISPVIKFIRDYFFKLGILDGAAGYTVSKISAYATYQKYKKLRTLYSSGSAGIN